jgi:hypothetical protein
MKATCSVDGCDKAAKARSWCGMHWYRWRTHGDVNWEPSRVTECTVGGCTSAPSSRGLCQKHYWRLKRTGTTSDRRTPVVDYVARFWAKVDRRGPDECWLWNGTILSSGYGQFWCPPKKRLVHRFAYELAVGPIPDGLTIDHVKARGCAHLNCVNPAHLEPVTMAVNVLRSMAASAVNAAKNTCPEGHQYGTRMTKGRVERFCRTCSNRLQRERRARSKA